MKFAQNPSLNSLARRLEGTLPPSARSLIEASRAGGHRANWLIGEPSNFANLISPKKGLPHDVTFTDSANNPLHELTVTLASNAVNVVYKDPANSKRPGHDKGFVTDSELPSSKPALVDAFGIEMPQLAQAGFNWLKMRELIVVPSKICDGPNGSVMDVVYITTASMAWTKMAWDIIHGTPSAERLKEEFNPKAVFLAVPGLRPTIFGGTQCTVFDRAAQDDVVMVYSNSSYQGLGMSKKPIFVLLSRMLAEKGQGMLAHATMATLSGVSTAGEQVKKGFIYFGASGHGKTEFRFVRSGLISLGKSHSERFPELVVDYPAALLPKKFVAAGDDGVVFRSLARGDGYGYGENSEKGGAFDRPSSANRRGDLPENDELLELGKRNPFRQLTLNMQARVDQPIETHLRVLDGEKPHSNPRHNYYWSDLARTESFRDRHIEISTGVQRIDTSIFGMGVVRNSAVISWANKLPICSAYALLLAGICQARSVSVTEGQSVSYGGLKPDRFGTMESFSINDNVTNANRLWQYVKNLHKIEHWTCPIGWVGPSYEVKDNEAELLLRDFLFHRETGHASWELEPAKIPFFGLQPARATFVGNRLPDYYCDPFKQYLNADEFRSAANHVLRVIAKAVDCVRFDTRLEAGAREALNRALALPVFNEDVNTGMRMYEALNQV